MAETWLLNETITNTEAWSISAPFNSNNQDFEGIKIASFKGSKVTYLKNEGNSVIVYDMSAGATTGWTDSAYRTITFDAPVTDTTLLTWLQANGTKQSNKLSVDLTTLSGWANLAPGTHTIKIAAKGTGYRDSEKSAGVSVTKPAPVYTDCLTFTGETSEFTLAVGTNGAKEWNGTLYYSTDHNTWNVWNGTAISSANKKLYLRGKGNTKFYTSKGARFSLSANAGCSGNIQTLLNYENPPTSVAIECYVSMFNKCTNVTTAPELPATTLTDGCYRLMFYGCTNLTTAPALPATTLADYCYAYMFQDCTNLTTAPALPATTLAKYCYNNMFSRCTKLKVNTSSGTKIFTCPSIKTGAVDYMFTDTGGTFTGTPTAGNTYYWTE